MKTYRRIIGLLAAVAAICALPYVQAAWALEVPALRGRINDYAGLLSNATARQLDGGLAQLEATDSTQIVVLTITSLEGDSLEDFSIRVVEKWQIGQKGKDNGALLLVSKNDRKIRIEAGYGLEGKLTDLVSGRIIRNIIVPQFKMGRYDQGIIDGVTAMAGVVRGEFTAPETPLRRSHGRRGASPGLVGLLALLFFVNMLGRINRGMGAAAGGVLAPIAGALFLNMGLIGILGLIPLGAAGGFLMSLMGSPVSFGRSMTGRHGGYWGGGFGGGGLGGGFGGGGFGGFSGGGGGFGGGGASGGW
jgi:uncharacterized protein